MKCEICNSKTTRCYNSFDLKCERCSYFEKYKEGKVTIGFDIGSVTIENDNWDRFFQKFKKLFWKNRKRLIRSGKIRGKKHNIDF